MGELTLGSLNLHMGRGPGGHAAPFYDVVTACKEIDTDVLVLQEAWVPDADEGDVVAVAAALGYTVAGTFAVARASCHDQVRLVAREGPAGGGRWGGGRGGAVHGVGDPPAAAQGPGVAAGPGTAGGAARPGPPGRLRGRHEHVGVVRRPPRRSRLAAGGAGADLPCAPAPQPDRPHPGQRPGRGGGGRRGPPGPLGPPPGPRPPALLAAGEHVHDLGGAG